jgi:hypothetical protein
MTLSDPEQESLEESKRRPDIKEWLLQGEPRFEGVVPKRGAWKSRPAMDLSGPEFE